MHIKMPLLILFFFTFVLSSCNDASAIQKESGNIILYQINDAIFTQKNMDHLIEFTEFLSRSPLTEEDKKALTQWAILDFKSSPKASLKFYKSLSNTTIKKIRHSNNNHEYKTRLFISFSGSFRKKQTLFPKNHILKIIDHYNPPVKEALQLQAFEHNMLMLQLQNNQVQFNRLMNTHKASTNQIIKSIKDHGDKAAIVLSGDKIIEEHNDHYLVEDQIGNQHKVPR